MILVDYLVFPASAGMNRGRGTDHGSYLGVPRVRGDEPEFQSAYEAVGTCSPRPRG